MTDERKRDEPGKRAYELNAEPGHYRVSGTDTTLRRTREYREIQNDRRWPRRVLRLCEVASVVGGWWLGQLPGLVVGLVLLVAGEFLGQRVIRHIIEHTER